MYRKDDRQWWVTVLEQKSTGLQFGIEDTECAAEFMKCVLQEGGRVGRFATYEKLLNEKYVAPYLRHEEQCYDFNGIRMPETIGDKENLYWECLDNIAPHLFATESWETSRQEALNKALQDGTYIYGNVRLQPGDVVIDAGANLGFFAAYAAYKGCVVHAFEPDRRNRECLRETAGLYSSIQVHSQALMDTIGKITFLEDGSFRSTAVFLDKANAELVQTDAITLDSFVKLHTLRKVDFIKADIEGAERLLLKGAFETLKEFAPKLSICTYHLQDDPQVLAEIILTANPHYKIIQGKKKLYAFVMR